MVGYLKSGHGLDTNRTQAQTVHRMTHYQSGAMQNHFSYYT